MSGSNLRHNIPRRVWLSSFLGCVYLLTLGFGPSAHADNVQYSHDEHYYYIRRPIPFTLDQNQNALVRQGIDHILTSLTTINKDNPRLNWQGPLDSSVITAAINFDIELDTLMGAVQKYYGLLQPLGVLSTKDMIPTGLILFVGSELEKGSIMKAGGSAMAGFVFVPQWETVIDIDTRKIVREGIYIDMALIGWHTTNIGTGIGQGVNWRYGVGLIWGELDNASDFHGFATGISGTWKAPGLGMGVNVKAMGLINVSKGDISNTFITVGHEFGTGNLDSLHWNWSVILDAKSLSNGMGAILNFFDPKDKNKPTALQAN